ncbi:asparagine synthase-related protein, partial [Patulibacter sp. S7RM1-6]
AAVAGADPQAHVAAAWAAAGPGDWWARAMEADRTTYLGDDLLPKVDLASMAHGLEVRSPLLDHRLVELAWRLPPRLRRDKLLLRRVARERLPAAIVARPKQGFALPLAAWLRGALRPLATEVLLDPGTAARGIVRPAAVEALLRRHAAGEDHAMVLWALLCLELWFRTCVDAAPTAAPALLA